MKKKIFKFLSILFLSLVLIVVILLTYFNVVIFVQNVSPTDDCVDIQVMSDKEPLVNDTFYYSEISPNYKMFFAHVSWGEHIIKVKSNAASIEKSEPFYFSWKRTYIITEYQYHLVTLPKVSKGDTIKIDTILNKKQFILGVSTKRPRLQ